MAFCVVRHAGVHAVFQDGARRARDGGHDAAQIGGAARHDRSDVASEDQQCVVARPGPARPARRSKRRGRDPSALAPLTPSRLALMAICAPVLARKLAVVCAGTSTPLPVLGVQPGARASGDELDAGIAQVDAHDRRRAAVNVRIHLRNAAKQIRVFAEIDGGRLGGGHGGHGDERRGDEARNSHALLQESMVFQDW